MTLRANKGMKNSALTEVCFLKESRTAGTNIVFMRNVYPPPLPFVGAELADRNGVV